MVIFKLELKCESSSQLGLDYAFTLNPVMELIYDNIDPVFEKFKSDYNKSYPFYSQESFERKNTFHRNLR